MNKTNITLFGSMGNRIAWGEIDAREEVIDCPEEKKTKVCPIKYPSLFVFMHTYVDTEAIIYARGAYGTTVSSRRDKFSLDLNLADYLVDKYGLSVKQALHIQCFLCPNCKAELYRELGEPIPIAIHTPTVKCHFCD